LWVGVAAALCLTAAPEKAPAESADEVPAVRTKLLRYADISRDRVVFAYGGDLWIAPREGGAARRLTSHVGDELYPKFSPDGKWIAFTGEYDGNPDVYLISSEGGEPKRLTFHPSNDIVLGWTPDGKNILFRSDRYSAPPGRFTRLFLVSPQGGMPQDVAGSARRPDFVFAERHQDRLHRNITGIPHLEALPRRLESAHRHL
jgi:Tol biopolymer transport system component